MGRTKVKLEPIAKERSRNTTFQKRTKGMKKKAYEFSTLCGVDACLIIYGPKQGDLFVEPETWPEDREDVLNIIDKFRKHNTEERGRRHIGLPEYLEEQTKKLRCELAKLRQRNNNNNKVKYPTWDERINEFSVEQLNTLAATLKSKLELMKLKIDDLIEGNLYLIDDDVTGLIGSEYSVPPSLNQNPSPPPTHMHMHHQYQPLSYLRPVSDNLQYLSIPTDPSLVFQAGNGAIFPYHPGGPIYYNPMLPPFNNNAGGGALSPCYFSANMQPMMHPYFKAPQLHHQINEFSDLQDYQFNSNGVVYDSSTFHAHLDGHQWP